MDKNLIKEYSPIALVVIAIIIQWNMFVTPEKMEIKHREILKDVQERYTTKEQYSDLKTQLQDMRQKIDKIYEIMTRN